MTTASLSLSAVLTPIQARLSRFTWKHSWAIPLVAILLFEAAATLSVNNSAWGDEALYIQGGRALFFEAIGGPKTDHLASTYYSGVPYFYPVLAGAADALGGLNMVRMISFVFMILAVLSVFYITQHIFDRDSAYFAAALFVGQPAVLFLGHFATYDAMSLSCLAMATVFALRASTSGRFSAIILCGLFLFLGVTTKYAGLLFAPSVLAILGWQSIKHVGIPRAILHELIVVAVVVVGWGSLMIIDPGLRTGVAFTTTERVAFAAGDRMAIALDAMSQFGITALFALVGLLLLDLKRVPLGIVLWGSGLLVPAYHIYKTETLSMNKHLGFGAVFAVPLAGYALTRLSGYGRKTIIGNRWVLGLVACLAVFSIGVPKAAGLFSWGGVQPSLDFLTPRIQPGETRILSDDIQALQYHLGPLFTSPQWTNLYYFDYTDHSGKLLHLPDSYKAALKDGYFDLVIESYEFPTSMTATIDQDLRLSPDYKLVAVLPKFGWSSRNMVIWQRVPNTRDPRSPRID